MPSNPSSSEAEREAPDRAACLRAAIAAGHEALLRSVALLVARTEQGRRWPEVIERASEILDEAVGEALRHADDFDPSRSATAWVRGIAARLLRARRRAEVRDRRCVPATALGDDVWAALLEHRATAAADAAVAGRLDLEQALRRLTTEERRALECRYYHGLDGDALARALGVATPGAARVRVCRALQALRAQFPLSEEEALP